MPYKSLEITNANAVAEQAPKTSQFYKGFSSVDVTNPTSRLYDLELVKQDILNQFYTRRGERVMNPLFGSIIWDVLMEPMTPAIREALNKDITTICNSDSRVSAQNIKLTEYPTGYILEATLVLIGSDQSTTMALTFDQNIGLSVR